jgi:hypothetical protein
MPRVADRVRDTSTTTGTGDFTLSGTAPTGFRNFNSTFGTSSRFAYAIVAVDGSGNPTGDWEVGHGYLSGATTLVREQVETSSNSNDAVNFSAGTKDVFCTGAADLLEGAGRGAQNALFNCLAMR